MATQTTVMQTQTPTPKEEWLIQKIVLGLTPARLFLAAIIILAAFLNFYQLGNIGDGNLYYTAAVKSMLQSWHNFFFVAAEPGAAVTVDKPPLGLWVEAASAFVFGVNGFAVVLPNILAGLIAIPVLYHLTKKYFGPAAGLVAALVVAITPVAVAAQRNNTMDGMLTLVLLLAAWAFLKATETGRLRHLLLGALLVGLGFNIKMLQAFLPLPAFYAVYFLGAKVGWGRKLVHLGVATLLLLVVSLAWAVAVDLTPVAERPYVGSSTDNTVMELIIGHNGLNRWFGGEGPGTQQGAFDAGQRPLPNADDSQMPPPALNGRPTPPNGAPPNGAPADGPRTPPNDGQQRPPLAGGGPGGSNEVGVAGVLRFWQAPLSKEMSWLLPLALVGGLLVLLGHKLTLPLAPRHQFLLIWGGWLAVGLIFFSFAGFFHAYYLVMLAPPLAALVGAGVAELLALRQKRWNVATAVLLITAALTLAFQWFNAAQFVE